MTSVEEFNCILCKETFENKDELQIHFRKHGDPKFNESIKTKSRVQNEAPFANEKSNDSSELVNCDVCDEVFPTISKAITHKHKVHPEHDAKYFCPWCGKLFTLKHLYNKHLSTNHDDTEEVPGSKDSHFHCDSCSVYFVVPSAMVYHNKFFHRQDSDLPVIGHSKKQKLVNQDLLPVYYCSFCGEEYINKVNLHKHMCDDHEDENQRPTDVLRCTLCEAVFYHLDAYELHLTFHTSEDLYSETNDMNEKEMTEFSLETVPPVMERIEDLNNLPDVETDMNAVGIESFLQMAMDEPKDNDKLHEKRSKKHKKHKKSKKPAITLDEFLSMNQDVFGEDLDFQGIEVVPTKVITKQLIVKKPQVPKSGAKHVSSADLQKLRKLGIAVKVPSANKVPLTKIGQPIKVNPQVKNLPIQTKTNAISASNDVLSKLLNQSSSQLKIVKKSAPGTAHDSEPDFNEGINQQPDDTTSAPETIKTNNNKKEEEDNNIPELCIPKTNLSNNLEINDETKQKSIEQCVNENLNDSNTDCNKQNSLPIKNIGKQITIKSITKTPPCIEEKTANTATSDKNETDDENCTGDNMNAVQDFVQHKTNTLDTLRSLNSGITIKSLKTNSIPETNKNSTTGNEKTEPMYKKSSAGNAENNTIQKFQVDSTAENVNQQLFVYKALPTQVLQNINKNIAIKSMSPPIKHAKIELPSDQKHNDSDFDIPQEDTVTAQKRNNNGDKVNEQSVPIPSSSHVLKNISKNITIKPMSPLLKDSNDVPSDEHNDSDFDNQEDATFNENNRNNKGDTAKEQPVPITSCSQVLKNISKNITIKPMSPLLKQQKEDGPGDDHKESHSVKTEDSTSIRNKSRGDKEQSHHLNSEMLKNISKNITIKSMSPLTEHPKDDEHDESYFENPETDRPMGSENEILKIQAVPASSSSHVFKNISKNVTIKPMSHVQMKKDEDIDSDFDNFEDDTPLEKDDNKSPVDMLKNTSAGQKSNVKIKTLQSPYVNKKPVGNMNDNVTGDETCFQNKELNKTNIQSNNNPLKKLKNIIAKPVNTNKNVRQQVVVKSSNAACTVKQDNVFKKSMYSKEMSEDIEIYSIDDSDDEYEQQNRNKVEPTPHIKKEPIKANVHSPAVLNAIKNMSKHLTVKPSSNNQTTLKQVDKREEHFLDQFSDEEELHDDGECGSNEDFEHMLDTSQKPTIIKRNTTNKNDYLNNVLKQLGQNVTVKSKNTFNQSVKTANNVLQDFNQDNTAHDTDSEEESYPGKVKITEVTEEDEDLVNNCKNEGIVAQPHDDSNSGDEHFTREIGNMNEFSSGNFKVKLNENVKPISQGLLKNISKNITVKSLSEKTVDESSENGSVANQSSLCKALLMKPVKQNRPDITDDSEKVRTFNMPSNKRHDGPNTPGPSSPTVQQKFLKNGAVNTLNKEVKVKTFQSETVIEEITTTVTKTIRRVNQTTVNQQVLNAKKSPALRMVRPPTGPRMPNIYSSNNLKGLTVRQPSPRAVRPKIRQPVPVRPPSSTVVRPSVSNQLVPVSNQLVPVSNQLVPVRPGVTPIRPMNVPRMPVKNMPRQPRPIGRPLKISPNVVNQTLKRAGNEETQGHFSCFKKPKQSLIPGHETAETSSNFHYASTSQTTKFCSTSQTMKGNSVVTSTQMKAQSITQQQQINRLGNISGLKVAKTCQVSKVEKIEVSPAKRTALEAIEKLQKQGLLIKKPRVEEDPDPPNSDGEEYDQFDDYDYDE